MKKNNAHISIITLVKNDYLNFIKTLKSIKSQCMNFYIEWLVIDGSNHDKQKEVQNSIKRFFYKETSISIKHIDANLINIHGIYPCMNYGKRISSGKFIIFLNSGDIFFNKNSLEIFFDRTKNADISSSVIFGQAKIIANKKLYWYFPGKRLKSINRWLKYFEPNHQTMLVSKSLANKIDFPNNLNIIADGYWKREILRNACDVIYVNKPLIKFYLGGVSSNKPSRKIFKELMNNKNISFLRKLIFFIKYFFPKEIFFLYYQLQKYKSKLIDLII